MDESSTGIGRSENRWSSGSFGLGGRAEEETPGQLVEVNGGQENKGRRRTEGGENMEVKSTSWVGGQWSESEIRRRYPLAKWGWLGD